MHIYRVVSGSHVMVLAWTVEDTDKSPYAVLQCYIDQGHIRNPDTYVVLVERDKDGSYQPPPKLFVFRIEQVQPLRIALG